ncbi:MAG: 3-hydroxyacyl-CoA dehydrogenase NAD-binding domain-containing protein [Myxococcota bacterium]
MEQKKSDPEARDRFATAGLAKALKAKPAAFFDPQAANLITPRQSPAKTIWSASLIVNLVIEAVPENLDIKRDLFKKIPQHQSRCFLASNTSGLSIAKMSASLPAPLQSASW